MARIAGEMLGGDVAFEISIDNVDKPPLDFIEIDHRLRKFADEEAVWLTARPTFAKKAELFPGVTFVVGADTIERVGQQRYYGHAAAMRQRDRSMADSGCRFLGFRPGDRRRLSHARRSALGEPLAALCTGVPAEKFREDISSTELRRSGRSPGTGQTKDLDEGTRDAE